VVLAPRDLAELTRKLRRGEQSVWMANPRMRQVFRDLAENPASSAEQWTLESMAKQCGMGITAMAKYCRELVNNGPMAYLNLCRLEHAARNLMENPKVSVTDVAMRAGFNSSQYFATLFRKRYQMTPVNYRAGRGITQFMT
jgi:AraC family L-rhamnose operon regulatory protein RhaS